MIYKFEGHTYTAQAMQMMLRAEYRDRGLKTWNLASLDEMLNHLDEYDIAPVEMVRKGKWKADRHTTNMIVPHEPQLLVLWEMNIPLEKCIFEDDTLVANIWGSNGDLIEYTIYKNGAWGRRIFQTDKKGMN